jgi:hypothetical protein
MAAIARHLLAPLAVAILGTGSAGGMMRVITSQPLAPWMDCTDQPAGTVCRPAGGPCDVAETCDGGRADCPPDVVRDSATVCRPAAGQCDLEERCAGDVTCPADVKSTAVCRQAVGRCDVAEVCDGSADTCPDDQVQPASFRLACDDGNACTTGDRCSGSSGACAPRTRVLCDDPCHTGACDPRDGCLPHQGVKALTCQVTQCTHPARLRRLQRLARRIDRDHDAGRRSRPWLVARLAKLLERCAAADTASR